MSFEIFSKRKNEFLLHSPHELAWCPCWLMAFIPPESCLRLKAEIRHWDSTNLTMLQITRGRVPGKATPFSAARAWRHCACCRNLLDRHIGMRKQSFPSVVFLQHPLLTKLYRQLGKEKNISRSQPHFQRAVKKGEFGVEKQSTDNWHAL